MTLVETMIVICIMSLVVIIAIPNFLRARREANAKICVTNLKQIETAKDRWAWSSNASLNDLAYMSDIVPDFLRYEPQCPGGGTYTLGRINEYPTCGIGTNGTLDIFDDHLIRTN